MRHTENRDDLIVKSILITGANGFVGKYLVMHLQKTFRVIQSDKTVSTESDEKYSAYMDITKPETIDNVFLKFSPDIVLHLAANKNIDNCEIYPEEAFRVNLKGTNNIISACDKYKAFLIFMSSDYVFDGISGNYQEEHIMNPLTIYGRTKKEAEDLVVKSGIMFCIFRSGSIYGNDNWQGPLLKWASERLAKGHFVNAFSNIFSTPTCIYDVAVGVERIANNYANGIFHIAGSQRVSRWEFLRLYADVNGYRSDLVVKDEYKFSQGIDRYHRPYDLSLNTTVSEHNLRMKFRNISEGFTIAKNYGHE